MKAVLLCGCVVFRDAVGMRLCIIVNVCGTIWDGCVRFVVCSVMTRGGGPRGPAMLWFLHGRWSHNGGCDIFVVLLLWAVLVLLWVLGVVFTRIWLRLEVDADTATCGAA